MRVKQKCLPKRVANPSIAKMTQAPPGWTLQDDALTRTIQRDDFVEAIALVLEVAKLAETANHHPDIDIRYRTVHLSLSTHDAGNRVTAKDHALATQINDINDHDLRLSSSDLRSRLKA
jgi:4a-hydroxytetrahydrobiopterin dehydratase